MTAMARPVKLTARSLGPIKQADVEFGDLTVLVGPQATGKSLLLQSLKLGVDHDAVRATMVRNGIPWPTRTEGWGEFLQQFYGEGMDGLWTADTHVKVGRTVIDAALLRRRTWDPNAEPKVLYVPAQRALTMPDGFPKAFRDVSTDTPYSVREFSDGLHRTLQNDGRVSLFPASNKLEARFRRQVDDAIFHGGQIGVTSTGRKRYELTMTMPSGSQLPSIAWTAGQREFVPLLLALYPALPAGVRPKEPGLDWIVIEEPEMGLHPQAIVVTMYLVLELMQRGYRVALSTHHPVVIDVLWAIRSLRGAGDVACAQLLKALGVGQYDKSKLIARNALAADIRVFALAQTKGGAITTDISELDPGATAELEQGWGGLTAYSAAFADAVAAAANGVEG